MIAGAGQGAHACAGSGLVEQRDALTDAVNRDSSDPAPLLALADQYLADRRFAAALASVDRAIAIDSTNAGGYPGGPFS